MANVKFDRTKTEEYAKGSTADQNTIFFTNDTHEIIVDGQSYSSQYTLPVAGSGTIGGVMLGYTQNSKNYPVLLDDGKKAYVNVPWTNTTPNNGKLSITGEGTTVAEFTADQLADKTLDIKGVTGISVSGSDGQIIISADSNHTVMSKTGIVKKLNNKGEVIAWGTEHGIQAYELRVVCDLSGKTIKAVDINDFANVDFNSPSIFTWNKSADEQNVYLGLFDAKACESGFAFKLDIQNTLTEKTESHLYGLLVDTPIDATFAFVSTNSWPIVCKENNSDTLLAYLQVPDDFVGTIKLTPMKHRTNADKSKPTCFEPSGTVGLPPSIYQWSSGGAHTLSKFTSSNIYGQDIQGTIRTPYGNYPVNVIGDFGGNIEVGSKISDSIINDYFLHTLNKKVDSIAEKVDGIAENSDTKVKQTAVGTNANFPLLFSETNAPTSGNSYGASYGTTLTFNPSSETLSVTDIESTNITADDVSTGTMSASSSIGAHSLNITPSDSSYSTKQIYCSSGGASQNLRIWNPTHPSPNNSNSSIQLLAGTPASGDGFFNHPAGLDVSSTAGQTAGGSGLITVNGGTSVFGITLRGSKSGDTYTLNTTDGVVVTANVISNHRLIKITKPFSIMSFRDLTMGQVTFYFDSSLPYGTTIVLFNHENSNSGQWILVDSATEVHLTSGIVYVLKLGDTFTSGKTIGRKVYDAGTSNILQA